MPRTAIIPKGTRQQVLEAATKTGVRVVMFTDHRGPKAENWHGLRDGICFGRSEECGDASCAFPVRDRIASRSPGCAPLLSHPKSVTMRDGGMAGMEICNRHTDAKLDKGPYCIAAAPRCGFLGPKCLENFKAYR